MHPTSPQSGNIKSQQRREQPLLHRSLSLNTMSQEASSRKENARITRSTIQRYRPYSTCSNAYTRQDSNHKRYKGRKTKGCHKTEQQKRNYRSIKSSTTIATNKLKRSSSLTSDIREQKRTPSWINRNTDTEDLQKLLQDYHSPSTGVLSILDVALQLKKSLTLGHQPIYRRSHSFIPTNPTSDFSLTTADMNRDSPWTTTAAVNTNDEKKYPKQTDNGSEKENVNNNNNSSGDLPSPIQSPDENGNGRSTPLLSQMEFNGENFENFFLPSFDDECVSDVVGLHLARDIYVSGQSALLNVPEEKQGKCSENHNAFADDESVCQQLRKQKTVLLFDDDDDDDENDIDGSFSIDLNSYPLHMDKQPSLSLCEGEKAKISWENLKDEWLNDPKNDVSNNPVECNGHHQIYDLEDLLENDWLNRVPPSMSPLSEHRTQSYSDLSDMQGTYTCSLCFSNLEIAPFQTMSLPGVEEERSSFNSILPFADTFNHRQSHDCDVTLFCPSCSSQRVVFHADRLNRV